jgi:hypothetical protein
MPLSKKPSAIRAKDNKDLAHDIKEKFTHSLTWRTPYTTKWDRFYKLYRSVLDKINYPWQSNIFVPMSFSTVETVVPRLVSNRPQIDILPRKPEDAIYADVMNKLIDYQWDKMGMNVLLPEAVKEMCIYGTTILKVYWDIQKDEVIQKEVVDENMPELGTVNVPKKDTIIYNGPCVEVVDLYDFFIDPEAITIKDADWVIHRTLRTKDYIHEMAKTGKYKNVQLLEDLAVSPSFDDQKQGRRVSRGDSIPETTTEDKMIELLEYWEDDRVVTVANQSIVIRDEKNPYRHGWKPFVYCVDQKVPHEFYGIGEIEPIESLQYELNDRRNQRMDNVTLILNRMWKVVNGMGVDEDELISGAGRVVHMDNMNAVDVFPMQDVTSSSYNEETTIKSDIQQTTGVTDFTKGMASDALANDTATGISLLQEASNARFRLKVQNIEDMLIKGIGEMMVLMNEQFIEDDQTLAIQSENEGMQFVTIKSSDVRGGLDVAVAAGSTVPENQFVYKKQALDTYKLFAGDPNIDQIELKKEVLKAINPRADFRKLIVEQAQAPQGVPGMENMPMGQPETGMSSLAGQEQTSLTPQPQT